MSFDLRASLTSLAPTLASMLGGPLAGTAVTALESALGLTPGAGVNGVTAALQAGQMTPEMTAAVRAADQHHAEILAQQGIDILKINGDFELAGARLDVDDRKSAREREAATKDSFTPRFLAITVTIGFFGVLGFLLANGKPPAGGGDALLVMLGSLGAAWVGIINYYYGSSAGSAEKTRLMAKVTPAAEPNAATGP